MDKSNNKKNEYSLFSNDSLEYYLSLSKSTNKEIKETLKEIISLEEKSEESSDISEDLEIKIQSLCHNWVYLVRMIHHFYTELEINNKFKTGVLDSEEAIALYKEKVQKFTSKIDSETSGIPELYIFHEYSRHSRLHYIFLIGEIKKARDQFLLIHKNSNEGFRVLPKERSVLDVKRYFWDNILYDALAGVVDDPLKLNKFPLVGHFLSGHSDTKLEDIINSQDDQSFDPFDPI